MNASADTLDTIAGIARNAGKLIMPFFQTGCAGALKSDRSPVTEADLASHTFLARALLEISPRMRVVSEESDENKEPGNSADDYWLIDPLDGTKEFLKGKPEFTVNIAWMNAHGPVLGVVHAPALELTYLAQSGRGAWRLQGAGPGAPIRTRAADTNRLTVVASKDHSGPGVKRMLEKLPTAELTSIGSSLKFCLVAEGRADLYFRDQPTMEWDTAAAQCVLESAGGAVLDLSGCVLRYQKPELRNPAFLGLGDPDLDWRQLVV